MNDAEIRENSRELSGSGESCPTLTTQDAIGASIRGSEIVSDRITAEAFGGDR